MEDLVVVKHLSEDVGQETRRLDEGERQAIWLARELGLPLLIEEEAGRQVARELGLQISGIAGQLLRAVREKVTTPADASAKLDQLRKGGRINQHIFEAVQTAIDHEV